uniref:N-acetyltransferase domain-containing protein n=1 Tax=Aureoumbra lagunensis TaxID=44058 RepID=A0A7S3NK69_9STRA|mmetsp:Transcript_12890/g.19314  ORF Transcript_12890/g.19314 Transcript_12890/m.19314 type:complete len:250 (-) Transcript_12890:46-795(-)
MGNSNTSSLIKHKNIITNQVLDKEEFAQVDLCSKKEGHQVINILIETFIASRDPLAVWCTGPPFQPEAKFEKRLAKATRWALRVMNLPLISNGIMLCVRDPNDKEKIVGGVSLAPPENNKLTFLVIMKMMLKCGPPPTSRFNYFQPLEKVQHDIRKKYRKCWYIQTIGVLSSMKGKGFGSRLMKTACQLADIEHCDMWLETESERLVKFYQGFGFVVFRQFKLKVPFRPGLDTCTMWAMVREQNSSEKQ